jgi:hypothetical protein
VASTTTSIKNEKALDGPYLAQSVGGSASEGNEIVFLKSLNCRAGHELIIAPKNEAMLGTTDCDISLIAPNDGIQSE